MSGTEAAACRKLLDMTQVEFAALVHVSQAAVSLWENGRRKPTRAQSELIRIKVREALQTTAVA